MTVDIDSARFSHALRAAIFWPIGVILATALLLLVVVFELLEEVGWSNHSYQVLSDARQCETKIIRTQNGVRGFLLTGDNRFLNRYDQERDQAGAELAHIKAQVATDPEQAQNVEAIIQGLGVWIEHSKLIISQRRAGTATDADAVRMGTTIMEDLEARFDRFNNHELALRDSRLRHVRRMKIVLAYASSALALLLTFTIVYQVRRQMFDLAAGHRAALESTQQRHDALVRSERDLEEQKEWLRVTLTSIGDGVIVTDASGRVVLMNHESERLTGWHQAEALHQSLAAVFRTVHEETRAPAADPIAAIRADRKILEPAAPMLLLSRTGEEWPVDESAAPILDPKETFLGAVLVFRDATQRRAAQKSLKAYSADLERIVADRTLALQQSVSELEAFSYTVSHDLRSPLRAMQGFSEVIAEDYGDKLDDEGRHYLARIQAAAGRLDRLIQDLLSYTRISRQDTPLEILDLDKIVRDIIELDNHLQAPAADVKVEGPLPRVLGRETALNQVISNLLGNAAKFVREGEKPKIRLWSEVRAGRVKLFVEDHGIGIDEPNRGRVFDMFVQVNDPAKFGGTGVGLAIVRKAMQTMRGNVGVEPAPEGGSRFWIELAQA